MRQKRASTLEEGVAALSAKAAEIIGLHDRGTLEVDKAADLLIFDPDSLPLQHLKLEFPHGASTVVQAGAWVVVNGVPIIEGSHNTEEVPGRLLRARGATGSRGEKRMSVSGMAQ